MAPDAPSRHVVAGRGAGRETPRAPTTRFNCGITRERGFVYGALPLADIKAVKDHFDVTLNDVVLALVAGSLRSYLGALDELPEESLRTGMAVSLRTHDDDEFSNRVTTASTTLATALADPVERLRAIAADTAAAKIAAHSGGKGFLEFIGLLPPALVGLLMSSAPASIVPRFAGYNLLVSSVRGSPVPLYIAGARVTAMYPMSIIAPGGALNVTCISYGDEMDFGFTIEPSAFPDRWDLVAGLHDVLQDYLQRVPEAAR